MNEYNDFCFNSLPSLLPLLPLLLAPRLLEPRLDFGIVMDCPFELPLLLGTEGAITVAEG